MKKWAFVRFSLFIVVNVALRNAATEEIESPHARLEACISEYKDGNYQKAAERLQILSPMLSVPEDQMEAYKYTGFAFGMLNWIDKSKETFKMALTKFPAMNIDTLEVPPNIAMIFKQAKLEIKMEKIDASPGIIVVRKKNLLGPVLLLSASIAAAVASADLFYFGNRQYQKYKSINSPDQRELDRQYDNFRISFAAGAVCAGLAVVFLPVSIHLFMKNEVRYNRLAVSFVNGFPSLVCTF